MQITDYMRTFTSLTNYHDVSGSTVILF